MHLQPGRSRAGRAVNHGTGMVVVTRSRGDTPMPDITLPEVKLPDVKLPEGLRDMNRRDIQAALNDRMPKKVEMPDVDLSKVDLPKVDLAKAQKSVERRLKDVDLPKAVEDRLPRQRTNPILPIAAFLAVSAAIAAAWWLITSPTAALRVRESADRTWRKVTRQTTDLVRYDDDQDLASLLPDPSVDRPTAEEESWPDTFAELGQSVAADTKSTIERPVGS
jgi:hypothetical protein